MSLWRKCAVAGMAFTIRLVAAILCLMRNCKQTHVGLTAALPLLPLALAAIGYCVLIRQMWDSNLIWLARVRLLEQWTSLSRFGDLSIIYPEYPYWGAAAWWWTEWTARVPLKVAD